jgi:hypothetical protein
MYDLTVPVLKRGLSILSIYLDKAAAFADERKIAPEVLVNARLAPDMLPLAGQIQRASDSAKGMVPRLSTIAAPGFPDTETTLAELKQRIDKTIEFLNTVKSQDLDGSETRSIDLKFGSFTKTLSGDAYVLKFLLPNFFFHVATAHDILRHNGVKVGKLDYLGSFDQGREAI